MLELNVDKKIPIEAIGDPKVIITPEHWNYNGPSEGGYMVLPASRYRNLHAIAKIPNGLPKSKIEKLVMQTYRTFKDQIISNDNWAVIKQFAHDNPKEEEYIDEIMNLTTEKQATVQYHETWNNEYFGEGILPITTKTGHLNYKVTVST